MHSYLVMHSLLLAGLDSLVSSMYSTFDFPGGAGGGLAQLLQLHPRHQSSGTAQTTGYSLPQQDPTSLSTQLQFKQGSSHHGLRCSAAQSLPTRDNIAQGKLTTAGYALHRSLYQPEKNIAQGKSSHYSQGCSAAQSPHARDTSPTAHLQQCSSHAIRVLQPLYIGNIYLGSFVVPKPLPTSGSGDLSPTLGEEVCAPLWCKTSVLLYLLILGSATKSW